MPILANEGRDVSVIVNDMSDIILTSHGIAPTDDAVTL